MRHALRPPPERGAGFLEPKAVQELGGQLCPRYDMGRSARNDVHAGLPGKGLLPALGRSARFHPVVNQAGGMEAG